MEEIKLSRRQFLGGTAAVVGAAVLPAIANTAPAVATPTAKFPDTTIFGATPTRAWIPLDPKDAARKGYEIYRGMHSGLGQTG